jgi:hypothetical protein
MATTAASGCFLLLKWRKLEKKKANRKGGAVAAEKTERRAGDGP